MWIKEGASDQSVNIRFLDTTSGLPATTVGGGTGGLQMWYRRDGAASVGVSAIDISDLSTSHTDGGLKHINNGYYRFDVPDAAFAAGVDKVLVSGSATGFMVIGYEAQLAGLNPRELTTTKADRLLSIDGKASSATQATILANTANIDGKASSANMATVLTRTAFIDGLATSAVVNLANIRQQVTDGLSLIGLDHLLASQVSDAGDVVTNSVFGKLAASSGEWNQFSASAHSLQSVRLRGDTAWITATGFSTHSAADVWAVANRQITGGSLTGTKKTFDDLNDLSTSQVRNQVSEGLSAIHLDHLLAVSAVGTNIVDGAFLAQLATSAGDWDTFDKSTDSLEAIRERGDAEWVTATGFSTHSAADVWASPDRIITGGSLTGTKKTFDDLNDLSTSQVRNQVSEGLSAIGLDHLVSASAVDTDIADGSVFAQIATSTGDWSSYNKDDHSLQTIAGAAGLTTSQVRQQVDEALSAIHLDHLLAASSIDANVVTGAFLPQLATSTADFSNFKKESHSLQVIAGAAGLTTSQVRNQVSEALSAIHLDHLFATSGLSTDVATGALWAQLATSPGTWSSFNKEDHSLQTISEAAGLTAGQVRTQVDDALSAIHLDHLLATSSVAANVITGAFLPQLAASTGDFSNYQKGTDSLESIRNRGDAAWATAAGFSTHSAADVWAVANRQITGGSLTGTKKTFDDLTDISAAQVRAEASGALIVYDGPTLAELVSEIDAVQTDISNLNDLSTSQVRIQVTEGLSAIGLDHLVSLSAVQADIADGSVFGQLAGSAGDWGTFQSTSDSLEAIRNRGDAEWVTATGFSTHSAADVWANADRIITGGSLTGTKKTFDALNDVSLVGVRTQVGDGLSAIHLDHLLATSSVVANVQTGAFLPQMAASTGDWSNFSKDTDSLESIYNKSVDVETDTQNIQSRIPAALVSGRMDSDMQAIAGDTTSASTLVDSAKTIVRGTAITGTLSTTQMTTDLAEATDDHYNGRVIIWTTGVLANQATDITDYTGSTKLLTFTAVTEAPSNGDKFVIV